MAERVVKVTLSAQVSGYVKGMDDAARKTREVGSEAEKLAQKKQAFETVGRSSLLFGAAVGAGVALAVAKFAEFDQAMSQVNAVTQESAENLGLLRDAALDAGGETVFTATEAANAIEELGKAGLSTADIVGGALSGALSLAAADNLEVARAAEITATTLKQYSLAGTDAAHVSDVLAAGAGKALGGVEDLANGLKFVGPVAASMGVSLEETTGALALFADQGLVGEQAGTSLRGVLSSLTSPSSAAAKEIEKLGINLYDASGQFLGLENVAGQLSNAYTDLDDKSRDASLGVIFGNQQVTAARVLFQGGAEDIAKYTAQVDDAGYAAQVAADRLDNLAGDAEKLGGAFDTALIQSGAAANDVLRFLTQSATDLVDMFNEMPAPIQGATLGVGALTSAAALGIGAFFTLTPKVVEYNEALKTLGPNAQRAGRALSAVGRGVGTVAIVAAVVTTASNALIDYTREVRGTDEAVAKATTTNQGFLNSMEDLGTTTDATAEGVTRALDALASGDILGSVGNDILTLRDSLTELDGGLTKLPLDAAVEKFQSWGDELGLSRVQMGTMLDELPGLRDAIQQQLASTGKAADRQAVLNFAMKEAVDPAETAAGAIEGLAAEAEIAEGFLSDMESALRDIAGTAMGMGEAMDAAQSAINDMGAAAQEEGASLYGADDASIRLRDSMREVEASHRDSAQAILENKGTLEEARAEWGKGREAVITMRESMGDSREEAILWADQNMGSAADVERALGGVARAVGEIPPRKEITLIADTSPAMAAIERFVFNNDGRRINMYVDGYIGRQVNGVDMVARANGGIEEYANGGFPTGIYKGRPGGIHKFAEPETGWEAYISGKPGERTRNIGLWVEAGRRLGVGGGGDAGGSVAAGSSGVVELGPRSLRALSREVINQIAIDQNAIASASNAGNANSAWRGGNG